VQLDDPDGRLFEIISPPYDSVDTEMTVPASLRRRLTPSIAPPIEPSVESLVH
jgi:hypothetical protein